jgi:hypothetical protein
MNNPYQAGDVNDEASQYMETPARDHLRTVLENYQAPEPPPAQHIDDVTRPYVILWRFRTKTQGAKSWFLTEV